MLSEHPAQTATSAMFHTRSWFFKLLLFILKSRRRERYEKTGSYEQRWQDIL